jgi:type IV pilus assembly protein PilN
MIKINLLDASGEKKNQLDGKTTIPFIEKFKDIIEDLKDKYNIGDSSGGDEDSGEVKPITLIIKIIIAFSAVIFLYAHELSNLPVLEKILKEEEAKLKSLNDFNGKAANVVAEIKKMKKNKSDIERQIESIGGLSKIRLRYIKAIDIIQQNIQDKMWLTSLKTNGDLLVMDGVAHSDAEISTFIEILSKNIQFSEVQLLASSESSLADSLGKKFRNFTINCALEKIR